MIKINLAHKVTKMIMKNKYPFCLNNNHSISLKFLERLRKKYAPK